MGIVIKKKRRVLKALITCKFKDEEFERIKNLGYKVIFKDERDADFAENIEDIDVMVCFNPFNKIDMDKFTNLKWIQLLSAGIDQVDKNKILDRNIILTNNREDIVYQ